MGHLLLIYWELGFIPLVGLFAHYNRIDCPDQFRCLYNAFSYWFQSKIFQRVVGGKRSNTDEFLSINKSRTVFIL